MYVRTARTRRLHALAILATSTLAACSGGGGGSTPSPTSAPTATPTATPVSGAPTPPAPAAGNGYALFYFQLSTAGTPNATLRRPDFVAPNTQSVTITTSGPNAPTGGSGTPATGATQTTTFASGNPNCNAQGTTLVCYAYVQVPTGSGYSFQLFTFANGNKLAQANTGTTTISASGSSPIALEYNPIVASVALSFASPTVPKGTATNAPLTIVLKDAAGNDLSKDASGAPVVKGSAADQIFAGSVSLTSSDPTNAPVSLARVNRPSDLTGVTVDYNGQAAGPFTITGSISSAPTATATLTPQ